MNLVLAENNECKRDYIYVCLCVCIVILYIEIFQHTNIGVLFIN